MAYINSDDPTEQKHFNYLERLRQSGKTNMWGAAPYLRRAFRKDFGRGQAGQAAASAVLVKWMGAHRAAKEQEAQP